MVEICGSKHKGKLWSVMTGWGFFSGLVIAVFMAVIVSLTIARQQYLFDNGYDIKAVVVDYGYSGDRSRFVLGIEFIDADGIKYNKTFDAFTYYSRADAEAQIGKTVPIKTNGKGEYVQGYSRPKIPIIMPILFFAFSIFGIIGIVIIVKYQWLVGENRILKKGENCDFKVLSFRKKKDKDRYYILEVEADTKNGKRILFTASRFTEGEAAFCFALPKPYLSYRAKYRGNKIIIIYDTDYMRENIKKQKSLVFKDGEILLDSEDKERLAKLQAYKKDKIDEELKMEKKLTPEIRKQFGIGGRFVIPMGHKLVGTEKIYLYVMCDIDKLSEKYIGKKVKIYHNAFMGDLHCVQMSFKKNVSEEIGESLSERDALKLLDKYGKWFVLDGKISKTYNEDNVVVCEVTVPQFEKE